MLFVLLLFGLAKARLPFLEFHFDDQEYKEDRTEKETNSEIQKEFGTDYSYVDVKDAALHGDYEAKTKQSLTKDIGTDVDIAKYVGLLLLLTLRLQFG